jgi:hypothetical protein
VARKNREKSLNQKKDQFGAKVSTFVVEIATKTEGKFAFSKKFDIFLVL